jgi:hypothetical protein
MTQALFENTVKNQVLAYDATAKPSFVNGSLFVEFVADEMFDSASKARQVLDELKCLHYKAQMSGPIGNEYAYDFVA